jgi:hypothetical protein
MQMTTHRIWIAALAGLIALWMISPLGAIAQTTKGTTAEGALDKFLDPASADLATKLEVLQHASISKKLGSLLWHFARSTGIASACARYPFLRATRRSCQAISLHQ